MCCDGMHTRRRSDASALRSCSDKYPPKYSEIDGIKSVTFRRGTSVFNKDGLNVAPIKNLNDK
jgi:hypothetical protein